MAYVLGVDGGNTKTDYLLFTLDGACSGHVRAGTCSHEAIGLERARQEMDTRITELLAQADVDQAEIAASAFGLAGVDQPVQQVMMAEVVQDMGFVRSVVVNDSFLGIKAGSEQGVGVCSINGTGTAAGGIDVYGSMVQVGGGDRLLMGDEAGGSYIAGRTLRAAYDAVYRFGPQTSLLPRVLALLGTSDPEALHEAISTRYQFDKTVQPLDVIRVLFAEASQGDPIAMGIVRDVADAMARTAAGCAVRLRFDGPVPLMLIGSVWTKGRYQPMIDAFVSQFEHYAQQKADARLLEVPPAVGSVLWALELALGKVPPPALRARVLDAAQGL